MELRHPTVVLATGVSLVSAPYKALTPVGKPGQPGRRTAARSRKVCLARCTEVRVLLLLELHVAESPRRCENSLFRRTAPENAGQDGNPGDCRKGDLRGE